MIKRIMIKMNILELFKFRLNQRLPIYEFITMVLVSILSITMMGCGNTVHENNMKFKNLEGVIEPLDYQTISGPSLTLSIKKEIHFPYLELEARFAPPFELPRRLQGGALQFPVQSVKTQNNLDIYDKNHAFETNIFANVIWLNFDKDQGLWTGSRQIYLKSFQTIKEEDINEVEGTMLLRLPVDPMSVVFDVKNSEGKYEVKGVRFEIKDLSSKKVEILILGSKDNYMGMDARVKGHWLQTLGHGRSYTKTSNDQVITEEYRISVDFPHRVEAIKLYFCSGYTLVKSKINIQPGTQYRMNLD